MPSCSPDMAMQPIRFWQHWRAVDQIAHDYPAGADALVDQIRHPASSSNAWYALSSLPSTLLASRAGLFGANTARWRRSCISAVVSARGYGCCTSMN
jgi:hypothetical protein